MPKFNSKILIFIAMTCCLISKNVLADRVKIIVDKLNKNYDIIQIFENQYNKDDIKNLILSNNEIFTKDEQKLTIEEAKNILEKLIDIVIDNINKTLRLPGLQLEEQLNIMINQLNWLNSTNETKKSTIKDLITRIRKLIEENREKSRLTKELMKQAKRIKFDEKKYQETLEERKKEKELKNKDGGFNVSDEERRLIAEKIRSKS